MTRRGFTLIELLVVIAIIAILAAILFPVFARAREKARQTSCLSNVKQLALGTMMYVQDYDEVYPYWNRYADANVMPDAPPKAVLPYVKNIQIFSCPSGTGSPSNVPQTGWSQYGRASIPYDFPGPASYAYAWSGWICERARVGTSPLRMARVTRPAETILLGDSAHMCGTEAGMFVWSNVCCDGGWTTAPLDGVGVSDSDARHNGGENYAYCDGHAKWCNTMTTWSQFSSMVNPRQ